MIYLNDRDMELLKDLYELRILTIQQIKSLYFADSGHYVYNRLIKMKQEGLVGTVPLLEKRNKMMSKVGACYYITNLGIKQIEDEIEDEDIRTESRNIVKIKNLRRQLLVNNIPVTLREKGFNWIESRKTKQEYHLNKGDLIAGILERNGSRLAVYVPNNDDDVKKRITAEISRISLMGLADFLILCPKPEILEKYQDLDATARSIMVLPFREGMTLLSRVFSTGFLTEQIEKKLNLNLRPVSHGFAKYVVRDERREYYVTDLLLNDLVIKRSLDAYTPEHARGDRPVYLFLWDGQEEEKKHFENKPHIKILEVPLNDQERVCEGSLAGA